MRGPWPGWGVPEVRAGAATRYRPLPAGPPGGAAAPRTYALRPPPATRRSSRRHGDRWVRSGPYEADAVGGPARAGAAPARAEAVLENRGAAGPPAWRCRRRRLWACGAGGGGREVREENGRAAAPPASRAGPCGGLAAPPGSGGAFPAAGGQDRAGREGRRPLRQVRGLRGARRAGVRAGALFGAAALGRRPAGAGGSLACGSGWWFCRGRGFPSQPQGLHPRERHDPLPQGAHQAGGKLGPESPARAGPVRGSVAVADCPGEAAGVQRVGVTQGFLQPSRVLRRDRCLRHLDGTKSGSVTVGDEP